MGKQAFAKVMGKADAIRAPSSSLPLPLPRSLVNDNELDWTGDLHGTRKIKLQPEYRELDGKGTQQEQANQAMDYFRSWHDSIIDDIFGGLLESSITCRCEIEERKKRIQIRLRPKSEHSDCVAFRPSLSLSLVES